MRRIAIPALIALALIGAIVADTGRADGPDDPSARRAATGKALPAGVRAATYQIW